MKITEQVRKGVTFLAADGIAAAGGTAHGFSTRLGGVSEGMWASLNLGVNRGDDPTSGRTTAGSWAPSARRGTCWP